MSKQSECPVCGRIWSPSMDESTSFPGSSCDTGDCICGACEDGDCSYHRTGRYRFSDRPQQAPIDDDGEFYEP